MNHDQETYELIEAYLKGRLEGETLANFERTLQEDESLREEVELQRSVHQLLEEEDVQRLDETLTDIRAEYMLEHGPQLWPFRKIWFAAAAVFVLAIAYIGFFRTGTGLSDQNLYQAYFEPYPADVTVRADEDSTSISQLERALLAYESEEYQQALEELNSINNITTRGRFFQGLSYLALKQTERALSPLEEVSDDSNSVYAHPAIWYRALARLQLENRAAAISLLTQLSQEASGKYRNLATELLEKLQ